MAEGFAKLFSSILRSSVWQEPASTRLVWITMLAMSDRNGYVGASIPGIATAAGVTLQEAETAINTFLAPDRYSRSREHEGRRIAEADRGWILLNYARFRDLRDVEARKAWDRERKRADRSGQKRTGAECPPQSAKVEVEVDTPLRGAAAGAAPVVDSPRASPRLPDSSGGDIATSTSVPTSPNAASEQGAATTTPPATSSPRSGQAKAVPVPKPADVTDAVWQDWLAHRRAKKSTVTQRVLDDTRRKATAAGMTMDEALTHWVAQGYAGFFPPASKPGSSGGATFDRSGVIMKSAPPGYYSGPAVQDL